MIMENEQMKFDFQTQSQSDVNDLTKVLKQLEVLTKTVSELIDKHTDAEKKAESDLAVEKAYKMFVEKEETPTLDECFDQECPVDEKVFGEEKSVDDFSVLNLIPEQAKKWVGRLTIDEMIQAVTDSDKEEGYSTEDEYIGDLVDRLKDMAIAKYTNDILQGRITTIEDEEIRSEVVDYMTKKGYDIPTTIKPVNSPNPKHIDKIIERLDKGCEIELDEEMLDNVVEKLWNTRNNVSIKIHNNKISLR